MKLIKCISALVISAALMGCGGHPFEGNYKTKAGSQNEFLNAFAGMAGEAAGQTIVTIGSDYTESDGNRETFDDIFVRESSGKQYLIFKQGNSEEAWEILDENTLSQDNGLMSIKLIRVDAK